MTTRKVAIPVERCSRVEDFLKAVAESPDCVAHFEAKLYKRNGKFSDFVRYYAYYAFMNYLKYLIPDHFGCKHVSDLLEAAVSDYNDLVGSCRVPCDEVDLLIIPRGDLEDLVFPTTSYLNESLAYPWSEHKFVVTLFSYDFRDKLVELLREEAMCAAVDFYTRELESLVGVVEAYSDDRGISALINMDDYYM